MSQTIVLQSNIDYYQNSFFPTLKFIPRIGEKVSVRFACFGALREKGLPTQLEVKNVIYFEGKVLIDLHYSQVDIDRMTLKNINMFP